MNSFIILSILLALTAIANVDSFGRNTRKPLSSSLFRTSSLFNQLKDEPIPDNESEQQQRERLRKKARKMMFNENGVAYAPWIANQVDEDAIIEDLIRKEKKGPSAREKLKTSTLDSGAVETSEGMKWRQQGDVVEVGWITGVESDNVGYIVEKRPSYGGDFMEVASYKDIPSLQSKGPNGGKYRCIDNTASEGSWVYRVKDCDTRGKQEVLAQCFVEVSTESENTQQAAVAIGLIGILAAAAVVGYSLDPPL